VFVLAKGDHDWVKHYVLRLQRVVHTLDVTAFRARFQVRLVVATKNPKFGCGQLAPASGEFSTRGFEHVESTKFCNQAGMARGVGRGVDVVTARLLFKREL
jgi:hypothetical protein